MSLNHSPSIVTDGLVLCLDAANQRSYPKSGTTWSDLAGSNNGTLTNGPTFDAGNGGSIVFDGSDDLVNVGDNSDLQFGSGGSIAFWMKFRGTPGSAGYCVLNKGPGASRNPRITLESSKKINLFWEIADGTNKNTIADDACVEDTWTYVTCTWDGTTNKIYYNDALNTSESESGTPDTDTTTDLYIGHDEIKADGHFEGFIDDVVIYSDILELAEVKRNYNAGKRSHR